MESNVAAAAVLVVLGMLWQLQKGLDLGDLLFLILLLFKTVILYNSPRAHPYWRGSRKLILHPVSLWVTHGNPWEHKNAMFTGEVSL